MTQPSLFDGLEERGRTIQERFERFDRAHPQVYELFKQFAFELQATGRRRYSADMIVHRIRWHMATSWDAQEEFKINNDYVSRYARKLIEEHGEFADFFEMRELKAE